MKRIDPKRKKPKKQFRRLFARTSSRRQRAATASTSDFESEVPNQSIGQVLLVLLILHVIAIIGIYVHSNFIDVGATEPQSAAGIAAISTSEDKESVSIQEQINESQPPRSSAEDAEYDMHRCQPGDTYEAIAAQYQVSEMKLREINAGGRGFTPGDTIRIPKPEPKLITPQLTDRRAIPVGPSDSGKTVKVAPGQTLSKIARDNGTSVDALMKLNGIKDPRKLRAGQTLKLPQP